MRIREAAVGDLGSVVHVERECVEAPQWGEAIWASVMAENRVRLRCVLVAVAEGGGVVGFVVTGGTAGIAEIENVAVKVASRGQGVGKALCREAMRLVAERGAVAMELEVRASNAAARGMYVGLGFIEQGMRKGYYQEPVEHAVLMAAALTGREL